ncbi:class I SAM-dependent methyltransferase [Candidatus Gottesmanbacteria bacterium]|nr:class I SAM-dependent methyltransferase [Candidatus Gottesmanbacteria bacterium]
MKPIATTDVLLSKMRWEGLHKKESLDRVIEKDPTIQSYWRFLLKYHRKWNSISFLDLGCGVAWVSSLVAQSGGHVTGVDITKEAVIKSKQLFKKRGSRGFFVQGNLLALPFRENEFSFIWSCMSLEYVRSTKKAIKEAYRVLKPGGTMIAVVPVVSLTTLTYHQLRGDIPNVPILRQLMEWFHLKWMSGKYLHYGYEQSFTPGQLRQLFLKAGFTVKTVAYFPMYYPIAFIPKWFRRFIQSLLKYRLFWPLCYVEAVK